MKRRVLTGLALALAVLAVGALQAAGATTTIWQIGTFDYSRYDLAGSGLTGIHTFDFYVGTTPDAQFPSTLYLSTVAQTYDYRGVHLVNIHFDLASPYMDVNFIYGRGGDEVDYITLDGGFLAQISGTENSWEGSPYTIPIGLLFSGSHVITIEVVGNTILDDAHVVDALMLTGTPSIEVVIDIKPGSDPNCFNNDGHGVIPVAILGSADFDVTSIDPGTVQLEGLLVRMVGKSDKLLAHIEDVNNDGFDDLVVQIEDVDGIWSAGTTLATVTGALFDGTPIVGQDYVCITQ